MSVAVAVEAFTLLWLLSWTIGGLHLLLTGRRLDPRQLAASVFYHNAFTIAFEGDLDLEVDTLRMMLLADSHVEDASDDFVDDVSADEVADASYGRVTLTSSAVTDDDANDRSEWDFADVVFSSLDNVTPGKAVAYKQVGGDDSTEANDPLIALWDHANTAADGSDYTLQPGANGAVHFS